MAHSRGFGSGRSGRFTRPGRPLISGALHRDDVALAPFDQGEHILGPAGQRSHFLGPIERPIVSASGAFTMTCVSEDGLDDMWLYAKSVVHYCRSQSTEIM